MPTLNNEQTLECEGIISETKLLKALKSMINLHEMMELQKSSINKEVQIRRRHNWIFVTYFLFSYLMNSINSPNHS